MKLWNPHRNLLLKTYHTHAYEVLDAQASCDNSQICTCGMDKYVCVTDVATGKSLRKYRGHAGIVNCVKYNEDSSVILSGSTDNSVMIWDCKSRKLEPLQVEYLEIFICIYMYMHFQFRKFVVTVAAFKLCLKFFKLIFMVKKTKIYSISVKWVFFSSPEVKSHVSFSEHFHPLLRQNHWSNFNQT